VILGWGKIRRVILVYLMPGIVRKSLAQRHGECRRCGACCQLMAVCPALDRTNGMPVCRKYDSRGRVCKLFPLDERDLKDRDKVDPEHKCGFSFNHRDQRPAE